MTKVYFDNAATTALREEVIHEMVSVLNENFGNPSSTHSFGRSAKSVLESSRKIIAKQMNATASEIIFTSGATEATNWILRSAVKDLGIKQIITSKIEHHATLYTILALEKEYGIKINYLPILDDGSIDLSILNESIEYGSQTLVSLVHVNNETGEILSIDEVGKICKEKKAYFHCDAVQSIGKFVLDMNLLNIDFMVATAHKFHGPKGVGFAYIKKNTILQPMIYGGEQEKGFRAGTEAVHQIVAMAKALELAYLNLEKEQNYIENLKKYCSETLKETFPGIKIIGNHTFYNIINVVLPFDSSKTSMLLFLLDMKGIAVSRGSACQSGSNKPSHVLAEFLSSEDQLKPNIRISFSHFNTKEEIDYLVSVLKEI
ncbi:Cysteine desulfurase IscS [Flavobacterium sp. 9AF]|uniref:cysteine desulfurase family protein n=1 Tax=Flavobacterium sp. 9AF TaxID=2653142 RepID=UPI0012F106EE|nr:cysteine desulfurase family protein [Flavobacterium sp. 9AF]VXB63105.1 Cysteine desulfurase IscS [Flavobacterium sp. 9AF]